MHRTIIFTLALAALALPGPALAKGPKHCPPGLAKKTPACVPPGQAKKSAGYEDKYTDDRHERDEDERYSDRYDRIRAGDRVILNGEEYTVVRADDERIVLRRDDTIYRLPHIGDGSDYVRVGDAIVRVDPKTKAIVDWIRLTDLILS